MNIEERLQKECPLIHNPRFQYYCLPVTGGNVVPQTTDDVSESYIHMVDAQMDQIIDVIFKKKQDSGALNNSSITIHELLIMKEIFIKEKLYYDFLR